MSTDVFGLLQSFAAFRALNVSSSVGLPPPKIQKSTAFGCPVPDCGFVHTLSDRQSSLSGRPVCASAVRIACPAGPPI